MLLIVACKYRLIHKEQPQAFSRFQAPELKATKEEHEGLMNGGGEPNGGVAVLINKDEPHKPAVSRYYFSPMYAFELCVDTQVWYILKNLGELYIHNVT